MNVFVFEKETLRYVGAKMPATSSQLVQKKRKVVDDRLINRRDRQIRNRSLENLCPESMGFLYYSHNFFCKCEDVSKS